MDFSPANSEEEKDQLLENGHDLKWRSSRTQKKNTIFKKILKKNFIISKKIFLSKIPLENNKYKIKKWFC